MAHHRRPWTALTFRTSLGLLGGLLVATVASLLVIAFGTAWTLSAVRAYVGGEGLWSKAQKNAVQALQRYAVSGDESDWQVYEGEIAVPLADRVAREELEKSAPDRNRVRQGFVGGRNHPDDVAKMAGLFRIFRHVSYIDRAIAIWGRGDHAIEALRDRATRLRSAVQLWGPAADETVPVLRDIGLINVELTGLEDDFSYTLGEGARWVERTALWLAALVAVVLIGAGLALVGGVLARLGAAEARYRRLLATGRDALFIVDRADGRVLEANRSAEVLLDRPAAAFVGRPLADSHPEPERERILRLIASGDEAGMEGTVLDPQGAEIAVEIRVAHLDHGGESVAQLGYRDIRARRATEQALREREDQLRHAQKMEAVGQLAGGVAHDFNNLLTAILGYSSLIQKRLPAGDPLNEPALQVQKAAERAAGLTKQLLAFGRRQVLRPRVLDLQNVVDDLMPMLQRLLGDDVQVLRHPGAVAGAVRADRTQLEQVLVNLAVNARDAMPGGGRVTIGTDLVQRPGPDGNDQQWMRLTVSDTGVGMDEATQRRIFDPFFTTKERGRGTGLGLATVEGVVRQSGGFVELESALGRGTTFRVLLPWVSEPLDPEDAVATPGEDGSSALGTVLLAEDQEAVRQLARTTLLQAGFRVLHAADGSEALEIADQHEGPIHLLVTDVIMPHCNGRELAGKLALDRPEIRVLFMSGYADDEVIQRIGIGAGQHFLAKPFRPDTLVQYARQALEGPPFRDTTIARPEAAA